MFKDSRHEEAIRLYAKSNQFKLSQYNRNFNESAESLYFEIFRQNGENLGICSILTYSQKQSDTQCVIHNWAISCRFFEFGLEEFVLLYLHQNLNINKVKFHYQKTEFNNRVRELFGKYPDNFIVNDDNVELLFTQDFANEMINNTNLKTIQNG